MSSITRRFFWTEDPVFLKTIQEMFDHRAAADAEAKKLAKSIGADNVFWKGPKLGGFSFIIEPLRGYRLVAERPVRIYYPESGIGQGAKLIAEMEKLSVPMYDDAFAMHGIFTRNYIQGPTRIEAPQISFSQLSLTVSRVYAGVPYYRVGSPESMTVNRHPDVLSDAPPPHGWIEATSQEIQEYMKAQEPTRQ